MEVANARSSGGCGSNDTECEGGVRFGGQSVAIVAVIAVVVVQCPPQGRSSCWREATSEEKEDDRDEQQ